MWKRLLLFAIICLATQTIQSQEIAIKLTTKALKNQQELCGTPPMSPEQVKYLLEVVDKAGDHRNVGLTAIPIRAHIVTQSNGTGGLTLAQLNLALSYLNYHYYDAGIEFYICDINYIASSTHYNFNSANENALCAPHEVDDAANVFFVNSINGGGICGYAYYPFNSDQSLRLLIKNSCAYSYDNGTFPHEFGHFFNLAHTHEGTVNGNTDPNAEHVPRTGPNSNCDTDGDYLCDTEADPTGPTANCVYAGGGSDFFGNPYTPPVDNIMSYYFDGCGGLFTPQQYTRIANGLTTRLGHSAYNLDGCNPTNINDPSGVTANINNAYGMDISWVDNASNEAGYLVERSDDGGTIYRQIVGAGVAPNIVNYTDDQLTANTLYHYRVKASNDLANDYSPPFSINSGLIYCRPSVYYTNNCTVNGIGVGVENFTLDADVNPIDNNSGCDVLTIFTNSLPAAELSAGADYNFEVKLNTVGGYYIAQNFSIWIDLNQNGDFTDSGELLYQSNISGGQGSLNTGTISIPVASLNGNTTLRLRTRYYANGVVDSPCDETFYGETEDYGVVISGAPLPVELLDFQGKLVNDQVILEWSSLSEIDNDYYIIERSGDGIHFSELSKIKGAGYSLSTLEYSTIDPTPLNGINYYRLSQRDLDGSLNIHEELITIENKQNRTFQIFPNPGNGHQISLYFEKQDYDQVNCSIYDLSGKLRFNKSMEILKGETEKTLSLGDLPAGIYWIVLQNNHNREKIKYIVF